MFSFAQFLLNLGAQLENEHSWEKIRINWTICTFLQLWSWSSSLSSYIMQNHYRCHHNHCCHHHHHRPTGIFQNLGFSLPALWCLWFSLMSYSNIFLFKASFLLQYWTHIYFRTWNWFCIDGYSISSLKLFMLMVVSSLNSKFDLFDSFCLFSKFSLIP